MTLALPVNVDSIPSPITGGSRYSFETILTTERILHEELP
jgi:hypothetical protein